jgi:hypothetical protein
VNKIIFTLEPAYPISELYYPIPASKAVPDWYKTMPSSYSDETERLKFDSSTMKRCMPVFDALNIGYLILNYVDIQIEYDSENDKQLFYWAGDNYKDVVTFHPSFQTDGYKNTQPSPHGAAKFLNPWGIKTPKGYSCLFTSPIHREDSGIKILEGVVDTDVYNVPVQFPFIVDKTFTGLIPAGTPLVQVIPFKRDEFEMSIEKPKELPSAISQQRLKLRSTYLRGYRDKFRQSKRYK